MKYGVVDGFVVMENKVGKSQFKYEEKRATSVLAVIHETFKEFKSYVQKLKFFAAIMGLSSNVILESFL